MLYLFERDTGAKFRIVSFKGGGDAVLATLGGHVEMTAENLSEMLPLYETKKMRVLAVTGERRFARAPEVPTLKELGFNIVAATGRGFAMPAGVPKEAAATMEAALKRVHDSPGVQGVCRAQHLRGQVSRQRRICPVSRRQAPRGSRGISEDDRTPETLTSL